MIEPQVNLQLALHLGISADEYTKILEILGRVPTYTELGIFSVMWSEHCSYKNSIAVLKTLPRSGGRLLVAAGEENAGLVDIGDGLAVAFKIESHNHPSAVEPYQGAATGVGGILRDIFTMGARPIAALNSLRFGNPGNSRVRYLVKGVVKGIGDYGNSFGVPTVAGEVYFEDCYGENPLVNAMAVGTVKVDNIVRAIAKGEGNSVLIVGSSTGRDGIHGATFASEEISEESESKRPSVQVGDPFTEKLLLEATLEAIKSGHIVGIQDMGAAGISCSTSEMSARGKCGMLIDLDRVPVRESNMSAYEIMLSESQERMLLVVRRGWEREIQDIFSKWDLHAEIIGHVTSGDNIVIVKDGKRVADIPADSLVLGGGAPVYHREAKEPDYLRQVRQFDSEALSLPENLNETLIQLLSSPSIASKRWVYEQYDASVRTDTVTDAEGDAAIVRIKGTDKALALKTDCNARYVYLDPRMGARIAVAEAARNVVCVGGEPIAITNCLNFGNPYKPEIFWQFREAVAGIGEACRVLGTPVTGGNVSFYNESPIGAVYPTTVIGMLGLIESVDQICTSGFKDEGDVIILLGRTEGHVGGSEYLKVRHQLVAGEVPPIDLEYEKRVQAVCLKLIRKGFVKSAHDVSDGGLAICLAECCMAIKRPIGAMVELPEDHRPDFLLFGEDQSRIVVSVDLRFQKRVLEAAFQHRIHARIIGRVGGTDLRINHAVNLSVAEMETVYNGALENCIEGKEIGLVGR